MNRHRSTENRGDAKGFLATEGTEVTERHRGRPFIITSLCGLGELRGPKCLGSWFSCANSALARAALLAVISWLGATHLRADGPADNRVDKVRPIPPPGIPVPEEVRKELEGRVDQLGQEVAALRRDLAQKPGALALLPDIEVFHKAVDWALRYQEFYRTNEYQGGARPSAAQQLIEEGMKRSAALREGKPYWTEARGLVVRGYRSRIDGSVQPYGLVVPEAFDAHDGRDYRLDFWFHGRGEQLTELSFLSERMNRIGEFAPRGAFVLHPYGRYCNGSRFAGETDAWEALADVRARYPIDGDRLVVRGFSLGGASCWHFAMHYAAMWAAAAPGAGFSETSEFLRVFQNEELKPPWWEQKLWRWYDATEHAANASMVPLVAYSGDKDRQIQAAQAMERAMTAEGLNLTHILGPNTGHSYEPRAKEEINRRVDANAARGRDPLPRRVRFVTHTLRYDRMAWVQIDGLVQHWEPGRVEAELWDEGDGEIHVNTKGVTALTLDIPTALYPFALFRAPKVVVDGESVVAPGPASDRSWRLSVRRENGRWAIAAAADNALRKRHGLQGPIDDAFMDAFLFVRPTGAALNAAAGAWVSKELERAIEQWRLQYRGEARVVDDTAVSDADIAANHLVLWGDPQSNAVFSRVADRLPIRWDASGVHVPGKDYAADRSAPVLVYPNPLNAERYVVVNSGFTFREYDLLNNARQTAKLPDWAIVDFSQPANARSPGGIAAAGFFGERWEWVGEPR
ncbi:MAG: prolyl oligopeptidase family serine peptidase [Verrucomicrobiales bacterium]|nr:prolyl oligopeptidase family serine peptidase [Verrucomicrobiales bacterium]